MFGFFGAFFIKKINHHLVQIIQGEDGEDIKWLISMSRNGGALTAATSGGSRETHAANPHNLWVQVVGFRQRPAPRSVLDQLRAWTCMCSALLVRQSCQERRVVSQECVWYQKKGISLKNLVVKPIGRGRCHCQCLGFIWSMHAGQIILILALESDWSVVLELSECFVNLHSNLRHKLMQKHKSSLFCFFFFI